MGQEFYDYSRDKKGRYRFTSKGKKSIIKIVDFAETNRYGVYNLWFGNLLPDDTVDDMVISNNGDIQKVLATVIQIVREITTEMPEAKFVFKGSTVRRMNLYKRIIKTYYSQFNNEFTITAFILTKGVYREVLFETDSAVEYLAFFIKRNI